MNQNLNIQVSLPKFTKNIYKNQKQLNKNKRLQLSGTVDPSTLQAIDAIRSEWQTIASRCSVFKDIGRLIVVDYAVAYFLQAWKAHKHEPEFFKKWIPIDNYDLMDFDNKQL